MNNRKIEYWVIPPSTDAEFVAHMEEVLDTYAKSYNSSCPVICMDEQPVQLQRETRTPIPQLPSMANGPITSMNVLEQPASLCLMNR
jgi:hypothetical protein